MWSVTEIKTEQVTEEQMNQEIEAIEAIKQYGYEETRNPIVLLFRRIIRR